MAKIINVSVLMDDIDQQYLVRGKKGKYLNLVLRETPDDQYGNSHMVVQGIPKNLREEGKRGNILGNGKTFTFEDDDRRGSSEAPQRTEKPVPASPEPEDDVPF